MAESVARDGKKKRGDYNLIAAEQTSRQSSLVGHQMLFDDTTLHEAQPQTMIEFTFKIEGMTCVACSNSIERLMHNTFDSKDMSSASIVLLTHKMQATFPLRVFDDKIVTPKIICDTVAMIGFGCELLAMCEISPEQRKKFN